MLKEFKEFAMRGNVIDLAVGVIIGGAFGKIVTSLVNDVIMPPIGLLVGQVAFNDLALQLQAPRDGVPAVSLQYGAFISNVINFLIVAFCIFLMVKGLNALKKKEPAPVADPTEKNCPQCLMTVPIAAKKCGHCTSGIS